jgi:thiol-disulfide isomerase/thioredoxin
VVADDAGAAKLQSIADDYNRQLVLLEKQRLQQLAALAARQAPGEAAQTYELLFRLAIAHNRFVDAEPIAHRLLATDAPVPPIVHLLARTVDLVGATDRGAYADSLADLKQTIEERAALARTEGPAKPVLDTPALMAICDTYFQRLFQAGQYEVARKAAQIVLESSKNVALREACQGHLRQLELIGKPAPAIEGIDVDNRPFRLADWTGKPVLVVFWASWCQSNMQEVEWLEYVYSQYKARGFQIVGINLDTLANGGVKPETVLPSVKRFLLDNNVRWRNLINGTGAHDFAKAYGVTEIPASFLVGRDGTVTRLHLSRKNLDSDVRKAVGN